MRTVELNGYIDEEELFGDEITPDKLKSLLYKDKDNDVTLRINSYGGSCVAAVRMHDMIQAYPGVVNTVVSGIAASAAVAVVLAGKRVSITPGSLMMIHNPSTIAFGEAEDFEKAIGALKAVKESILNVYEKHSNKSRVELSHMMDNETWMDAYGALNDGFVDEITGDDKEAKTAGEIFANCKEVKKLVAAWGERRLAKPKTEPQQAGTPVDQLYKRLNLIKE